MTKAEIIQSMADTITEISSCTKGRVMPLIDDDEYDFVPKSLERWTDLKYVQGNGHYGKRRVA